MSVRKDTLYDEFDSDFLARKAEETDHFRKRMQGRNITPMMEEIIDCFGKSIPGKGGAQLIELPKSFLNEAEKAMRCRKVINEGKKITFEWKTTGTKKRMKSVSKSRKFKNRSLD